jgi:hypothetical protein
MVSFGVCGFLKKVSGGLTIINEFFIEGVRTP